KFMVRNVTEKEKPKFERLLLRMTISNGWAFQWTRDPATREFFEFLNPNLVLPGWDALSNRILNSESVNLDMSREQKLKEDSIGVTLAFDGWKNVLKQHIFGSLFILSSGEVLIWDTIDVSSERERMIEIIPKVEFMIKDASKIGANLSAIVSDSAPAYSGEIFKESNEFKTASKKAITIVAYFNNAIHSYFIGKLREIQKQIYNNYITLICLADTQWNSYCYCFKSLLKSRQALRNLAIAHELPLDTLTYDSDDETNQASIHLDELYLPQKITSILLSDSFWQSITRLYPLLHPYCKALDKLQSDTARLNEVLQAFGGILKMWKEYSDQYLAQCIILRLEQRWKQWEQPLLLLAFLLNLNIRDIWFNSNTENLNFTYIARFITYYYKAWFGHQPTCILLEYKKYRKCNYLFDRPTYEQFEGNILGFWEFASSSVKELGPLAVRLFGICINVASVERLWSSMGFLYTNKRNRLPTNMLLSNKLTNSNELTELNELNNLSELTELNRLNENDSNELDEEENNLEDIEPHDLDITTLDN
ncbi:6411_t:CDS:2, partial [Scutellospora calospora]